MKIYKITEASNYLGVSINKDMQKIVDANEKLIKELKNGNKRTELI